MEGLEFGEEEAWAELERTVVATAGLDEDEEAVVVPVEGPRLADALLRDLDWGRVVEEFEGGVRRSRALEDDRVRGVEALSPWQRRARGLEVSEKSKAVLAVERAAQLVTVVRGGTASHDVVFWRLEAKAKTRRAKTLAQYGPGLKLLRDVYGGPLRGWERFPPHEVALTAILHASQEKGESTSASVAFTGIAWVCAALGVECPVPLHLLREANELRKTAGASAKYVLWPTDLARLVHVAKRVPGVRVNRLLWEDRESPLFISLVRFGDRLHHRTHPRRPTTSSNSSTLPLSHLRAALPP